jgi:ankyrin repeat protein
MRLHHSHSNDYPTYQSGRTALHWAVTGGRMEACRVLLENGADVTARDNVSLV